MNGNRLLVLSALVGGLAVGCGGGGGAGTGSNDSPTISAVASTDVAFASDAAARMNQRAYFRVTGSKLPSTLSLAVADCTSMTALSITSTEAHFQCMPSFTEGSKAITVQDKAGGTTLFSGAIDVAAATSPLPMPTYGFNLGNSLEAMWGYAYPGPEVFTSAAKAGFNAVRIPCAWNTNADPVTHKIDPAYMARVKDAVDRSIAAGMHVFINVHWDNGWFDSHLGTADDPSAPDPAVEEKVKSLWTQIATAFADYDNRLLFAAANEPDVRSPAQMKALMAHYQTFVNTVRAVGGRNTQRWLVLQGGGDTSWFNTLPTDSTPGRLMVEYHNYTPSLFTIIHEDQSWGNAIWFWGAAYHNPANPSRNATFGEEGEIDSGYQQLKEQYVDKGIPVLVGELQAAGTPGLTGNDKLYNTASTLYWNKYAVESAQAHGLSPFYWSTPNAPFRYDTGAITNPELVTVLTGGEAPPPPNGAPKAVTGLTAKMSGTGQVSLSWNPVAGATSYQLYRSSQSGYQPATPFAAGISGTSYVDAGLNEGTTYYYQVVAVNAAGPSGFTTEAFAAMPGTNPDPAKFSFETDTQRWFTSGSPITGIATSADQHYAGKRSLAVNFSGTGAGQATLSVAGVNVPPGGTVSFRVWVPAGHQITSIETYLQDRNWGWTASWNGPPTAGAWNTLTFKVPSTAVAPSQRLGLKISTGAAWTGTLYVDSVDWSAP